MKVEVADQGARAGAGGGLVVVIGGGVSGLACAHALSRGGREVRLIEAAPTLGGVTRTFRREGFRFELGPNTIPASARQFRELTHELGLSDALKPSSQEASRRYLFHRGRLRALPSGPGSFLFSPLLGVGAKLRMMSEPLRKRPAWPDEREEPTFEAFLEERLGREATQVLAGAFVRGVYAAELADLGARSAFGKLWTLVNDHGGLLRGGMAFGKQKKAERATQKAPPGPVTPRGSLLTIDGGLGAIGEAVGRELGARARTGVRARAVQPADGGWSIELETSAGAETLACAEVVLAVPAPIAAALVAECAPAETTRALQTVAHARLVVVHQGFRQDELALPPGFGFLVPPTEPSNEQTPRALGILFPSNIFPDAAPAGHCGTTGIYPASAFEGLDDESIFEAARDDLRRALHLGEAPRPVLRHLVRWSDVIPRYGVGHRERMERASAALAASCPGLHLAGNFVGGVSVEDCIRRGRELGARLCARETAGGAA